MPNLPAPCLPKLTLLPASQMIPTETSLQTPARDAPCSECALADGDRSVAQAPSKPKVDPKFWFFFANVSYLGNPASDTAKFLKERPEHCVGIIETRLRGDKAERAAVDFRSNGWTPSYSPAQVSSDVAMG